MRRPRAQMIRQASAVTGVLHVAGTPAQSSFLVKYRPLRRFASDHPSVRWPVRLWRAFQESGYSRLTPVVLKVGHRSNRRRPE